MVETARDCGASAKFAGSGGAIIGVYRDEAMFNEIRDRMAEIGSITIRPIVTEWKEWLKLKMAKMTKIKAFYRFNQKSSGNFILCYYAQLSCWPSILDDPIKVKKMEHSDSTILGNL